MREKGEETRGTAKDELTWGGDGKGVRERGNGGRSTKRKRRQREQEEVKRGKEDDEEEGGRPVGETAVRQRKERPGKIENR